MIQVATLKFFSVYIVRIAKGLIEQKFLETTNKAINNHTTSKHPAATRGNFCRGSEREIIIIKKFLYVKNFFK